MVLYANLKILHIMRSSAMQLRISISFLVVFSVVFFSITRASFHADSLLFSVNKIFSDDMVLQRDQPIHIWGKGLPGKTIQVQLGAYRDWETDRKSTRLNSSH